MCILKTSENLCYKGFISYPETKIYENQFTFITGESGCGKSSFLKLLNSSSIPTSGTVFYEGKTYRTLQYSITEKPFFWCLRKFFFLTVPYLIISIPTADTAKGLP